MLDLIKDLLNLKRLDILRKAKNGLFNNYLMGLVHELLNDYKIYWIIK